MVNLTAFKHATVEVHRDLSERGDLRISKPHPKIDFGGKLKVVTDE